MAKLYWRVKRDGKWSWVAATRQNTTSEIRCCQTEYLVYSNTEVEE